MPFPKTNTITCLSMTTVAKKKSLIVAFYCSSLGKERDLQKLSVVSVVHCKVILMFKSNSQIL